MTSDATIGQASAQYIDTVNTKFRQAGMDPVFGSFNPSSPDFLRDVFFTVIDPVIFTEGVTCFVAKYNVSSIPVLSAFDISFLVLR